MQILSENHLGGGLEDGFRLVALQSTPVGLVIGLAIFVVTRKTPDPASGNFVLLRETPQARVFLGCTADTANVPQEWLEIWVQNTRPPSGLNPAYVEHFTNATWDARWSDLAMALRRSESGSVLTTPLENGHLPPAILAVSEGCFQPLNDPQTGRPLALCTDEGILVAAGLPGYASSPYRYLIATGETAEPIKLVRLDSAAPTNERTIDLADACPSAVAASTLGLDGGGVIVRRFAPLSLEDFSDVVGGKAWKGLDNGRHYFRLTGVYRLLDDEDAMRCGSAHLFSSAQGRVGRLSEALYLKLQALLQAFQRVRAHVAQSQLPFLNLTAESFRVRLGATGLGLPFLWTGQTDLVRPGQAFALPLRNTLTRYFQGLGPLTASVYRPGFVGITHQGTAHVRVRKVFPPTAEGMVLEGTLRSSERLFNDENDLLCIHLPLSAGSVDLYGHLDLAQARSGGEAVFRTIPQTFSEAVAAALPAIEGSTYGQLAFDILPPLSTPFDLYSLGVIALRLLLATEANPLAEVLDRAFSLAHEAAQNPSGETLEDRIAKNFETDPRWRETLGYQHALRSVADSTAGDATLPPQLWWATISLVLRLFPKLLPESFCKGYGDAPPLALESVFDAPIRELTMLLLRWRAFLLGDWRQNQEITRVIGSISAEY